MPYGPRSHTSDQRQPASGSRMRQLGENAGVMPRGKLPMAGCSLQHDELDRVMPQIHGLGARPHPNVVVRVDAKLLALRPATSPILPAPR